MRLEPMRNKLLELLAPKYAIAVALVLVLAFGGALGATNGLAHNTLDGIQLVQNDELDNAEDESENLADEGASSEEIREHWAGWDDEAGEGDEESEYPPELGANAANAEGAANAANAEGAEGAEGAENAANAANAEGGPYPGEETTVPGASPSTEFDGTVTDSEGNTFSIGTVTSDADGNVTFTIPAGAASGEATLTLTPTGGGADENLPFDIATNRIESTMVSLSIGAAILLALGGMLFAVVRRRRAAASA